MTFESTKRPINRNRPHDPWTHFRYLVPTIDCVKEIHYGETYDLSNFIAKCMDEILDSPSVSQLFIRVLSCYHGTVSDQWLHASVISMPKDGDENLQEFIQRVGRQVDASLESRNPIVLCLDRGNINLMLKPTLSVERALQSNEITALRGSVETNLSDSVEQRAQPFILSFPISYSFPSNIRVQTPRVRIITGTDVVLTNEQTVALEECEFIYNGKSIFISTKQLVDTLTTTIVPLIVVAKPILFSFMSVVAFIDVVLSAGGKETKSDGKVSSEYQMRVVDFCVKHSINEVEQVIEFPRLVMRVIEENLVECPGWVVFCVFVNFPSPFTPLSSSVAAIGARIFT